MNLNDRPLDPNLEFADPEADAAAAAAEAAEKAEIAAEADKALALERKVSHLEGSVAEKLKEIDGLRSKTAILDKLQEALGTKPVDEKDEFITKEIRRRLGGDLDDIAKIKEVLPVLLQVAQAQIDERTAEKVGAGQETLKTEMKKLDLDTDDEDAVAYMEEAVTAEIRRNPDLMKLWGEGKSKQAVVKAFDKVQTKLFAPMRNKLKRSAVNTILNAPKATPKGGAPSPAPAGGGKVDTSDTSRSGISKVHDAAWDKMQELLDRE